MAIKQSVLLAELVMSIQRLMDNAEKAPTIEGEWPPAVVLGHLVQVDEQVWLARLNQMVSAQSAGEPAPLFAWWEPDPQKTLDMFKNSTVAEVSAELIATRTKLVQRLRELSEEQWAAIGEHSTFGVIDVTALLIELLRHDEEHRESLLVQK
jgi:hypothetical protein